MDRNEKLRLQTFVANRVSSIREGSKIEQWHYVDTNTNPADDASRAKQSSRWREGPEFLFLGEEMWPKEPESMVEESVDLELKPEMTVGVTSTGKGAMGKLIDYYSCWKRLCRGVVWWVLFVRFLICQFKGGLSKELIMEVNVEMMVRAKRVIVGYVQSMVFPEEKRLLLSNKDVSKCSPLVKLRPVMRSGVMCVGGRLGNSELTEEEKHPIILPYKDHVTDLIINEVHVRVGQMGRMYVLNELMREYWVMKGNAAVRRVLNDCVQCKRTKAKVLEQQMAELPNDRVVGEGPPFLVTGVDCFGPFMVKRGRAHVKRWGVLFTCLRIRAIHLEVAADLTTDSFMNALSRFLARRGQVKKIRCDRGSNFVGAKNILEDNWKQLNTDKIRKDLVGKGIDWEFNPPGASNFGGVWERMIGIVRKVLESVMGLQTLDDDSLGTLFCEVEAVVNSRPLNAVSMDASDVRSITPNTLLTLGSSPEVVELDGSIGSYSLRRWRHVQYMADQFWQKWRREYLMHLQKRQKWVKKERNVKVGDIVLMVDVNLPRCQWPLARVVSVKSGADGLVRRVEVFKNGKRYERSLAKLVMILEDQD